MKHLHLHTGIYVLCIFSPVVLGLVIPAVLLRSTLSRCHYRKSTFAWTRSTFQTSLITIAIRRGAPRETKGRAWINSNLSCQL